MLLRERHGNPNGGRGKVSNREIKHKNNHMRHVRRNFKQYILILNYDFMPEKGRGVYMAEQTTEEI